MLYFVVFVVGIICGRIISFMVEENRRIQRLKGPKTYTLDEAEALLGLTAEKKGMWVKGIGENGVNTSLYCDQCGYENGHWYEWNFCPNCGARMEESE